MKYLAATYIVIFYTAAILKPVLPYVADFLAHQFAHEKHMATVHSHNGHEHAHHEAADAASDEDEQNAARQKFSEPVSAHQVAKNTINWEVPVSTTTYTIPPGHSTNKPLLPVNIPPPKSL